KGHVIVCGYGRFGRAVAGELARSGAQMFVIDADPAREEELRRLGTPFAIGSAVEDGVLDAAGIGRARAIVVATPSDPDNVFITLSAREKNPGIRIHARAETEAGLRRLELAGAPQTLAPHPTGGGPLAPPVPAPTPVAFPGLPLPRPPPRTAPPGARTGAPPRLPGTPLG